MKNFNKITYQKMFQKAKNNFYKSDAPTPWKNILKNLKVSIQLNPKFTSTAAMIHFDDYSPGMSLDNLTQFEGKLGKWIMELNPKNITKDSYYEILDVVSHELAHALDFIVNKKSYRCFHNYTWKYIHKCMGGSGKQFYYKMSNYYNKPYLNKLLKEFQNA